MTSALRVSTETAAPPAASCRMTGAMRSISSPSQTAFALKAVEQGATIVRVHDVFETVQALRVWRGLRDQALTPRV
jgi:hypothetical protein